MKSSLGYQVFHWYLNSEAAYYWWLVMKIERSMAGHSLYIIEKIGNGTAEFWVNDADLTNCATAAGTKLTWHRETQYLNNTAFIALNSWKLSNQNHWTINRTLSHSLPNNMKRLSLIFIEVICHLSRLGESRQTHFVF